MKKARDSMATETVEAYRVFCDRKGCTANILVEDQDTDIQLLPGEWLQGSVVGIDPDGDGTEDQLAEIPWVACKPTHVRFAVLNVLGRAEEAEVKPPKVKVKAEESKA